MTRLAYFLSLLLAGTTTACDDLIPIPQHECGNGVTEAGEACDGEPNCEPAGAVHACRYGCDTDIDCPQASTACSDEQGNCEAKWQCGRDGLCRRASGKFLDASDLYAGPALHMTSHDLDRDGLDELVRRGPGDLNLLGDVSGQRELSTIATVPLTAAAENSLGGNTAAVTTEALLADLNADEIDDLSIGASSSPFGGSLSVFRVQPSLSTLNPTLYPNLRLPSGSGDAHVFVARIVPGEATAAFPGFSDHQLLQLATAPVGPPGTGVESGSPQLVAYPDMNEMKDVATAGVVLAEPNAVKLAAWGLADIDTTTPCEELLLGHPGANQVQVYALCRPAGDEFVLNSVGDASHLSYPPIAIANDAKLPDFLSELQLSDVDGDGQRDVAFVVATNGGGGAVHVAYGAGDGSFSSDDDPSTPTDQSSAVLTIESEAPVNATSVLVSGDFDADGHEELRVACQGCQAVVADFDASGTPDIAMVSPEHDGISLSRSMGDGSFTLEMIKTPEVFMLTSGDIDGDGLSDLLYSVATGQGDEQALAVAFGQVAATPTSTVLFGALPPIVTMRAGRLVRQDGAHDTVFVVSPGAGSLQTGLMVGSSSRLGGAPYAFDTIFPTFFEGQPAPIDSELSITPRQLAAGSFGDVAAVVALTEDHDPSSAPDQMGTMRLWLLATRDEAIIAGELATSSLDAPTDVACRNCLMVVLNIDDDSDDEVLLFDQSSIHVFEHVATGLEATNSFDTEHDFAPSSENSVRVDDLDGDKHLDVLLLDDQGAIVVYFGSPSGEFDSTTRLTGDEPFTGLAVLHADDDAALEVAAVGEESLSIIHLDGRNQGQTVVVSQTAPSAMTSGARRISSGDFDGDGVADLVDVRANAGFTVRYGQPVLP